MFSHCMNYDLDVIPGCLGKEGTFLKPPDTKDYDTWLDGIPLKTHYPLPYLPPPFHNVIFSCSDF